MNLNRNYANSPSNDQELVRQLGISSQYWVFCFLMSVIQLDIETDRREHHSHLHLHTIIALSPDGICCRRWEVFRVRGTFPVTTSSFLSSPPGLECSLVNLVTYMNANISVSRHGLIHSLDLGPRINSYTRSQAWHGIGLKLWEESNNLFSMVGWSQR